MGRVFGHGEQGMGNRAWGMGKKLLMPNAQRPKRRGRLFLSTHGGMEFLAAFYEDIQQALIFEMQKGYRRHC